METVEKKGTVIYMSHGGGPLPLLGDKSHSQMVLFMKRIAQTIKKPEAIVVVSAHWEESVPTIIGSPEPPLLYDYYGFPEEAYSIHYDLPGNPNLAQQVQELLSDSRIDAKIELTRGFDHGVFIPLMLMYPEGSIPTIQISLIKGLNPQKHMEIGKALRKLRNENMLIVGSGFSFHNMNAFTWANDNVRDQKNDLFQDHLIKTCTNADSIEANLVSLIEWENYPNARYCHPREEHMLPLHVCMGVAESTGRIVFDDYILGKRAIAVMWD